MLRLTLGLVLSFISALKTPVLAKWSQRAFFNSVEETFSGAKSKT